MIDPRAPVGILGGTFDPVHYGHLRPALEVLENLALAEVRLIPCRRPPHREQPLADAADRLAMLQRAVADQPGLTVDDRELRRDGPSYMVDTLSSLRDEVGEQPLCLLLGMDAFVWLHTWHRWRELLMLAHLVVVHRPASQAPEAPEVRELLERHRLATPAGLRDRPAGAIWVQVVTQLAISATQIRTLLAGGHSPRYLLPDSVFTYIRQRGLYRPPTPLFSTEG